MKPSIGGSKWCSPSHKIQCGVGVGRENVIQTKWKETTTQCLSLVKNLYGYVQEEEILFILSCSQYYFLCCIFFRGSCTVYYIFLFTNWNIVKWQTRNIGRVYICMPIKVSESENIFKLSPAVQNISRHWTPRQSKQKRNCSPVK